VQRVPSRPKTETRTPEKKDQIRVIDRAKDYHRNKVMKKPETKSPAPVKVSPRKKAAEPAQKKQVKRKTS
jgi:hypothetical protein